MADPRFYINRGPLALTAICARLKLDVPADAGPDATVADVATIESAGSDQLVFCATRSGAKQLGSSRAGYCLTDAALDLDTPGQMVLLRTGSSVAAFAVVAEMLYPDSGLSIWNQAEPIDPSSKIGGQVQLAPGVVVGVNAEIGDGTRIGPNAVIGPGVAIGRNCEIGSSVTITHAYLGDEVLVLPGAQIGQPGFGFASSARGHAKIPQLGRVIVQDRVEIGACTTIDRGALGDTVIGEGTKIDNLVQIGHNTQIGRHCVIVGQVGMSGSCELGDFVVLGGQVGLADHVKIGDGARLAARSAMAPGTLPGGRDYGGAPPIPIGEWRRQMAIIARLTKPRKQNANG